MQGCTIVQMASIQRLVSPRTGDVSYRAEVRVKGRPTVGETFPNLKEATDWARSLEAAVREHRYFPHARAARMTFADGAKRYREPVLVDTPGNNRATRIKQLAWWERRFVELSIAEITPDRIADVRDEFAAEPYVRAKPRTLDVGLS
jgi:hypothetical protein